MCFHLLLCAAIFLKHSHFRFIGMKMSDWESSVQANMWIFCRDEWGLHSFTWAVGPSLLRGEHQALLHPLPRHDATHCFLDVLTSLCGEWSSCVWVQRTIACCWVHCGWELGCTMPCMCGSVRYSPCVQTHDWREERKNNSDYFFFLFSFYLFFLMLRQVTYALHLAICWCRHL